MDSFADRIERAVAERVGSQADHQRREVRQSDGAQIRQFVLGLASLVAGIPMTIVPIAVDGNLSAVVVSWIGIAAVNAAHAAAVNGPRRNHPPAR